MLLNTRYGIDNTSLWYVAIICEHSEDMVKSIAAYDFLSMYDQICMAVQ